MWRWSGQFGGGMMSVMLMLCAVTVRGDDGYFKDGTKLVDSEFAHTWAANEDAEEQILSGLCQRVDVDLKMTLEKFEKWLQDEHGLPAELDREALHENGIDTEVEVHVKGKKLRMERVLDRALKPLGLSWRIDAENLEISPVVHERYESRVYSVKRLIDGGFELPKLTELLIDETSGPWQVRDHEGGVITTLPRDRILVRQTQPIQFEIARLIRRLQELD